MLDKTDGWGLQPTVPLSNHGQPAPDIAETSKQQPSGGKYSGDSGQGFPPVTKPHEPPLDAAGQPSTLPRLPKIPEFNMPRIVKPRAEKAKIPKYTDWMENETYLNGLKQQSYIKDQPVVIPGGLPIAPVYGPSRELQIKAGPSVPTVYAQRITLTDIGELLDENQNLRNRALDRMWSCPICENVTFKHYDNDGIREHAEDHRRKLEEAGQCPWCGIATWAVMTSEERREHSRKHTAGDDIGTARNLWKWPRCPTCDVDFSSMLPDAIIKHCLDHTPDALQYCDKCGLHEAGCTTEELAHHHQVCRQAPERQKWQTLPIFCERCGKNISSQSSSQVLRHATDCPVEATQRGRLFCTKCGLDTHLFNNQELENHAFRCTVPGGVVGGMFCGRCATNLTKLSKASRASHNQTCSGQPSESAANSEANIAGMLNCS